MKITTDEMRMKVRSLDERVKNAQKYPDVWIDNIINMGFELVATRRQPFLNEEVLDLTQHIVDGTKTFQVDMDYDVLGYKRIFTNANVTYSVRPDNIVDVYLESTAIPKDTTPTITFQYYYIPIIPVSETYMSRDVYQMLENGFEAALYDRLRDTEKYQLSLSKLDSKATTVINGLDIDVRATDEWNGGFI